jgi:hypothetical protein
MNKTEFLQGLKQELEGHVPYSVIQENLRYYDSYISGETAKGQTEEEVVESLGGPRIIARTILDAAFNTQDRPDGFSSYSESSSYEEKTSGSYGRNEEEDIHKHIHYIDFSQWKVRLITGLIVFVVLFLLMTLFFGIIGLAGWVLRYMWPVLLVLLIIWMFKGPNR